MTGLVSAYPDRQPVRQLWAPVGSIALAVAEVLCYNELTVPDPLYPIETRRIAPQCFYVRGGHVKYICFEGGERTRVEAFRHAGFLTTLRPASWNSQLSPYTIRRMGEDPRAWVNQALDAYSSFSRNLIAMARPPDPCHLEAEVLVYAQEMIKEAFGLHIGGLVDLKSNHFPAMLYRAHTLYNVTTDWESICVPCSKSKPCLLVTCSTCKCKQESLDFRRDAAKVFLSPPYTVLSTPEFVKEIWRSPVVGKL